MNKFKQLTEGSPAEGQSQYSTGPEEMEDEKWALYRELSDCLKVTEAVI